MTNREYESYKSMIKDMMYHGSKESLVSLYKTIIVRHGFCQELRDLDRFYNSRWSVLDDIESGRL